MTITGKNSSVGTSPEDIITAGALLTEPTTDRIHAIVSDSTADDYNGTPQVETATIAGTVDGILQVETATIVGTIGASGAGNVSVVVTGALVTGSPLTIPVAVANNDTNQQVAAKVRTALGIAAITDNYTVSGATDKFILTTKVKAANDATLNLAYTNGTATGLTNGANSANTTAGHAGSGNVTVVVTGALVTGSPLTVSVPVLITNNPSAIAAKVRTALNIAAITDNYTVSGATDKVILTTNDGAANDGTLNIAVADGTSNGVTTAATSANTTAGIAHTGARSVEISGVNEAGTLLTEVVKLNGTGPVNTVYAYLYINSHQVKTAGSGGTNAGTITATAATDNTVTSKIEVGKLKAQQAIYAAKEGSITNLSISAINATGDGITYVDVLTKKKNGVWNIEKTFQLTSASIVNVAQVYSFSGKTTIFKLQATASASAGSSSVVATFDVN